MKKLLPILFLVFLFFEAGAQDIIGKNRRELAEYMRENYREFRMRNPMNVDQLNFYKFEHISGDKTIIATFNKEGICDMYQLIIDAELLDETIVEMNRNCSSVERKIWECEENGHLISVVLNESDWFFILTKTIVVKPEE